MNLIIAISALVSLTLLVYSMWVDDKRHSDCECPPEEDPSFVWYPIRWGLIGVQALVFMSNALYVTGDYTRLNLSSLKDFCAVVLGLTYALTLINPKWSITIVLERLTLRVKTWLQKKH
jgi:hypothetical protein